MSSYHFFSDSEFAGPGPSDLIRFWDRQPRQLRLKPRSKNHEYRFPDSHQIVNPMEAKHEDAPQIAIFWNKFYGDSDWKFKCTYEHVVKWMNQGFILLIRNNNKDEIIATFSFRRIPGGVICGLPNSQAAILDGLVIKPEFRKSGLASFILAYIDKKIYNLPDFPRGMLIWFREHDIPVNCVLQTPIAVLKYSYLRLETLKQSEKKITKPTSYFVNHFVSRIYNKTSAKFTLASLCTSDTSVLWFFTENTLIGIADTHRVSIYNQPIWEIVFAANEQAPYFENLQEQIECAAFSLQCANGLLFASNGLSRGNINSTVGNWVSGKSGYLTAHVYNWMPPTLLTGDILFPHAYI